MSSLYPPQILVLPLRLQNRLPLPLQSVDLEVTLVIHTLLALFTSLFTYHINYALPLSLFGLVAVSSSLVPTLLPHFLFFWIISIPFDLLWLIYRADQARLLVIALLGANMCFKVVSALQAARILQSQGALPDVGGYSGIGTNSNWLGSGHGHGNGNGSTGPFGLPGSWSGQAQAQSEGPYTDARHATAPQYASNGGYQSVYDEEDAIAESDAPQVRIDHLTNTLADPSSKGVR